MQSSHGSTALLIIGSDFPAGGDSSGAELQPAWFGGVAVDYQSAASSRRHMTIESCMAEVRRTLYAAGRPLKKRDLLSETGRDGIAIGSVLAKRQRSALVAKLPPPLAKANGACYLWVGKVEPEARQMAWGTGPALL